MNKTDGIITTNLGNITEEERLFSYDEKERQKQEVDSATAKLVFTPAFIPYYPHVKKEFDLSDIETLLYGFISFYLTQSSSRFYFTNEQLGELVGTSTVTVSKAMKELSNKGLLTFSYRVKAGGGKIRFVSDVKNVTVPTLSNLTLDVKKLNGNNNKINNNKINNKEKEIYKEKEGSQDDKSLASPSDKKYVSLKEITKQDITNIASRYKLPEEFVLSKYEDMCLWVAEKPSRDSGKRNWHMTLMNWVKKDAQKIIERRNYGRKVSIDPTSPDYS